MAKEPSPMGGWQKPQKPFSAILYDGVHNFGYGLSFIYNEAVLANALERNGAEIKGEFDTRQTTSGEDLNIVSRHVGAWLAAAIAVPALLTATPIALGIAAAIYTTMTVLPATVRIGRFKKVAYENALAEHQERVARDEPAKDIVQDPKPKVGAFAKAPHVRKI